MKFSIETTGVDKFIGFIKNIPKIVVDDELKIYIAEKSIEIINKYTKSRLKNYDNYIEHNQYKLIPEGILLYNDVEDNYGMHYSLIIEYGSGTYANEMEHIGDTPEFLESNYEWWYAGRYVKVHGQEPKHIYKDAAKEIAKNLPKWVVLYINENLRKGVVK